MAIFNEYSLRVYRQNTINMFRQKVVDRLAGSSLTGIKYNDIGDAFNAATLIYRSQFLQKKLQLCSKTLKYSAAMP